MIGWDIISNFGMPKIPNHFNSFFQVLSHTKGEESKCDTCFTLVDAKDSYRIKRFGFVRKWFKKPTKLVSYFSKLI